MQQLTLIAPGQLDWQDVPPPRLESPDAALVRPLAVARCDFDRVMIDGRVPLPGPIAVGHECVAEVVEIGEAVTAVAPGDRVVVAFQVSCGSCGACRRGRTSSCADVPWLSGFGLGPAGGGFGGAMSDLLLVPYADAMLVAVPDGLASAEAAVSGCNIPDAYRCVAPQLAAEPGAPVLVVGGDFGSIALYAAAIAVALGAERVDLLDDDPDRRRRAAALGVRVLDGPGDVQPRAYPITVDAGRDPERLRLAIRATAPDGVCTVSGMYIDPVTPVPLMDMFMAGSRLETGQPHARTHLEPSLELLATGALPAGAVVSDVLPWDAAPDAYATAPGKVVFERAA